MHDSCKVNVNKKITNLPKHDQVHVRQGSCSNIACNCAVAVREGNNVLGVYACGKTTPPTPIRYLVDSKVPGAEISTSIDGLFINVRDQVNNIITVIFNERRSMCPCMILRAWCMRDCMCVW